jgi:hypothetical protein
MNVEIIFTIMSYMFPSRTHYELAWPPLRYFRYELQSP